MSYIVAQQVRVAIARIIRAMRGVIERPVFVGGAVVPLLATELTSAEIRPTVDVDVCFDVLTHHDFHTIQDQLRRQGFVHAMNPGDPICRMLLDDLVIDFMPTESTVLGFSNRWYRDVVDYAEEDTCEDETPFLRASAVCFVATKLEAFFSRGRSTSSGSLDFFHKDIEDVITVLEGRTSFLEEWQTCQAQNARMFVGGQFERLMLDRDFLSALDGHIRDPGRRERVIHVMKYTTTNW
jgi:hypothetical protein